MRKIKYLSIASALALLVPMSVNAKYNQPDDVAPQYAKDTRRIMNARDKNFDSKLSPEEYAGIPDTRSQRRQSRQAKKDGSYMKPSEEFKKIDANEDGYITQDELVDFYKQKYGIEE